MLTRGGLAAAALSCLLLAAGVRAQDAGPDAGAQMSGPPAAVDALERGRRAKEAGELAAAERRFREALSAAERGDDAYAAALEELTYRLPLMRVERYYKAGQWDRVERRLRSLLKQHKSDEDKSRHLMALIGWLRDRRAVAGGDGGRSQSDRGRQAVQHVKRIMARYLAEHGRYPDGYRELNQLLPADRFPLKDYDIVRYAARGQAYALTLRSKENPDNLLSVQKTGLVE